MKQEKKNSRVRLILVMIVLLAALLAAIFLDEMPQRYHFVGTALIFSGIYLTTARKSA